jgi:hypothetical protein
MLKQIDRDIWVAQQPLKYLGLPVGTRMTAIRLSGDRLLLISPIKINEQIKQELDRLGKVEFIIAPNLFHYLYLEECQQIYPQAKLIAPPGLVTKKPKFAIDQVFFQDEIDFNSELEYILFEGFQVLIPPKISIVNEIVFFHPESHTLILTDAAFNFDRNFPLVTQLATRILGSYQALKPSWLEKLAIKDKTKISNSVEKIFAWDFKRVIMAHGNIVEDNAKEQLKAGYEWFIS